MSSSATRETASSSARVPGEERDPLEEVDLRPARAPHVQSRVVREAAIVQSSELAMDVQGTQYARAGELSIAYAVGGEGPVDVVVIPNWTTHLEASLDHPLVARYIHRLESFARLIRFDLPGTGMSDPVALDELPTMEEWRDCVRVVMDAARSRRAVLLATDAAGAVAIPFASTYPDRAAGLVLIDTWARLYRDEDYSFGFPERTRESGLAWWMEGWGTGRQLELTAPALADDPHEREAVARLERFSTSPGVARAFFRMVAELDVREILPAVRVPTLVLHRAGNRYIRVEHGRYLADRIPAARYVELPGEDHFPFYGDTEAVVSEIRSFLATLRSRATSTGCWRRSSSRTSSARRGSPLSSATSAGATSSTATTSWYGPSSHVIEGS